MIDAVEFAVRRSTKFNLIRNIDWMDFGEMIKKYAQTWVTCGKKTVVSLLLFNESRGQLPIFHTRYKDAKLS
jgi:hypothetical protein